MNFRLRFFGWLALVPIAATAGFSCSSNVVVTDCSDGEVDCGGDCTDLASDPDNCGRCGNACDGVCVDGTCSGDRPCVKPFITCGDLCVDTTSDPANCGGCGVACPGVCFQSQCQAECPPGLAACNGTCVDTTSDPSHCGFCNNPCGPEATCSGGVCQGQTCGPGETLCSGVCTDTQFDPFNCGFCGNVCGPGSQCEFSSCTDVPECDDPVCDVCTVVVLPSEVGFSVVGDTTFAQDDYLPQCTGFGGAPDIVHVFRPSVSGVYTIDTVGSSYDTTLELLDDNCNLITCSDDVFGLDAMVQADLVSGQQYKIIVDGFDAGEYQLNVQLGETCPPGLELCGGQCVDTDFDPNHCGGCFNQCDPGDSCEFGGCIEECFGPCGSCPDPVFLGDFVPATFQGDTSFGDASLFASCGESSGNEVLHQFRAPASGNYVFSTANSSFDTVVYLLDASSCTELACNDNFGMQLTSRTTAFLTQGQEVYVVVDGNFGAGGFYNLRVNGTAQAQCPTLALPSQVPQTISGNTMGASAQFTASCAPSQAPEHTFTFTAPTTKTYAIDTVGSSYDTVLYVLSATCTGQQLACNDDTVGLQSRVSVPLTAGQTVTIVVDGFDFDAGSYQLHIQ